MSGIDLLALAREKPIHFMGVGGAGMGPLAELVLQAGLQGRLHVLEGGTIPVSVTHGHDASHIAGCGALVVTAAVAADHPEIIAAREAGIPVLKRAEALAAVVNEGCVIGVAGTHGKTTTTALTAAVLTAANMDPTGIVGGHVLGWQGNLRVGSGALYVVEADEYDRSFLTLQPTVAVVTTMEADHLDVFGTIDGVEQAFLEYVDRVPTEGLIVASADDSGVGRLIPRLKAPRRSVMTYGTSAGSMMRAEGIVADGRSTTFVAREFGRKLGKATVRVPGIHNVRNSLAAAAVARHLGAPWRAIAEGLESYTGVERRFEEIGRASGVLVIDDYAHHPTEITATLSAARAALPSSRIVAVFQPHLYTRTRDFATQFGRALAAADLVFVTDIYPAREQPIPGVSGELIVAPAKEAGADVRYLADRPGVPAEVVGALRAGDVCITLGAGDLNDAAREILELLKARDVHS